MTQKAPMPDRTWAWRFHPNTADDAMQGGWTEHEDKRETPYLLATPAREAADDMLEALVEIRAWMDPEMSGWDQKFCIEIDALIARAKGGAA